jgi:hypothetical protein
MTELDLNILSELIMYEPKNNKIRFGNQRDAGYAIIDGYDYDLYISGGISTDVSFDVSFNSYRPNMKGYAFDASVGRPYDLPNNYEFISKFIGTENTNEFTNLEDYIGDSENIFIKMDIEGCEWDWINKFNHFSKVKQLVIECHGLFDPREDIGWPSIGKYKYPSILESFKKLNETHYLVHFHANNAAEAYCTINNSLGYKPKGHNEYPTVVELTYIRKIDSDINGLNFTELPILGLDYANYSNEPDFKINYTPLVNKK